MVRSLCKEKKKGILILKILEWVINQRTKLVSHIYFKFYLSTIQYKNGPTDNYKLYYNMHS